MRREVLINGKKRIVELVRTGDRWDCRIDGQPTGADVAEISPGVYSILLGGRSFEARVERRGPALEIEVDARRMTAEVLDHRRRRRVHGHLEREGKQEIRAPMPGKVVRVLVAQGDSVEAGQGILVLEAMKMQNEVLSPKSGTVEILRVRQDQPVNAGDVLAEIG